MTQTRPRAYVAGKYSDPTPEGRLANTERAMEVGIHLWRKGYAPFIPHLFHFTDELATRLGLPIGYQEWLAWDDAFQETCHIFFYDSSSSGADREYRNAIALGQPVFRNLEDVPATPDIAWEAQREVPVHQLPHAQGLPLPDYQTPGAAGMDLRAAIQEDEPGVVGPGKTLMVPTGLTMALPTGCAGFILPRSGLASRLNITMANSPGLIDSDFRGEVVLALYNFSDRAFTFERGERLAQFVLLNVNTAVWSVVNTLPETSRGEGGLGSTGLL